MSLSTRGSFSRRTSRNQQLAAALTAARQRAGITQRKLAAQMDRAHSFVGKIELCEQELGAVELLDYARALGMDAAKLLRQVEPTATAQLNADEPDSRPTLAAK